MTKTEKQLKGFEGKINGMFGGIAKGLGVNLAALTKVGLIVGAIKALASFGKQAVRVASDLQEVQNVVDVTFGSMANQVNEFASNATKQFGLSELSAKKFTSTMGAMLKSSGISGQTVTDMSIEIAKLTADMASFYNLDAEEAFAKIRSGLSGETEPLKQLGINMSVANLQAYALSQGINKSWQEMSQAEQTMLRYNYLLSATGDAQGDFARTSGSWANQTKLLKEQWQEFLGLIGKALTEILLPIVKGLNKLLEILIDITKTIGQIWTMITGKEAVVESNSNIADTAFDAAEGEEELADGIGKAAKAAKGALASFDEINQLQESIGSSGGALGNALGNIGSSTGQLATTTTMSTKQVDNGPDKSKWEGFFVWIGDWWNRVKQMMAVPVMVPAPIFATIPQPIYSPEWGLTPPLVPKPVFQPIPSPVYNPEWNLVPPPVPQIIFPPIIYTAYNQSLETVKNITSQTITSIQTNLNGAWNTIETNYDTHKGRVLGTAGALGAGIVSSMSQTNNKVKSDLGIAWNTIETNYRTHKENLGAIATGIATTLITNIGRGWTTLGNNTNKAIETIQQNFNTWGISVGELSAEIAKKFVQNLNSGFSTVATNLSNFGNSVTNNLRQWGSGVLTIVANTAQGFVSNFTSGLQTAWENFKNFMSATGQKAAGFYQENKKVIITTAVVGGVVLGGALALANPATAPFVIKALGALKAVPALALAKGGITNGPTFAMVGDNPGGREVVSPLDDLMGMIQNAVNETDNSGGDLYITVKIGEDTITEKVVNNINRKSRISGKTVIQV